MSLAWSQIQGNCSEVEEDPDPIFNGNYQIGRDFYEGEDEDIIEKDEATESGNYGKGYIQNLEFKKKLYFFILSLF